jgi:hypothetical protein
MGKSYYGIELLTKIYEKFDIFSSDCGGTKNNIDNYSVKKQ